MVSFFLCIFLHINIYLFIYKKATGGGRKMKTNKQTKKQKATGSGGVMQSMETQ